jgi:hypothetical protein
LTELEILSQTVADQKRVVAQMLEDEAMQAKSIENIALAVAKMTTVVAKLIDAVETVDKSTANAFNQQNEINERLHSTTAGMNDVLNAAVDDIEALFNLVSEDAQAEGPPEIFTFGNENEYGIDAVMMVLPDRRIRDNAWGWLACAIAEAEAKGILSEADVAFIAGVRDGTVPAEVMQQFMNEYANEDLDGVIQTWWIDGTAMLEAGDSMSMGIPADLGAEVISKQVLYSLVLIAMLLTTEALMEQLFQLAEQAA